MSLVLVSLNKVGLWHIKLKKKKQTLHHPNHFYPCLRRGFIGGNAGQLVSPPDWNITTHIGWIVMRFCTDIQAPQWIFPPDFWWSSDFSSGATSKLTFVFLSQMSQKPLDGVSQNLDGHLPLRMNCNHSGNSCSFSLAPSSGQNFKCVQLPTLVYDQIPPKPSLINTFSNISLLTCYNKMVNTLNTIM